MSQRQKTNAAQRRTDRERRRRSRDEDGSVDGGDDDSQATESAAHGSLGDIATDLFRRAASPTMLGAAAGAAAVARLTRGQASAQRDDDDDAAADEEDSEPEAPSAEAEAVEEDVEPDDEVDAPPGDDEPADEKPVREQPLGGNDQTTLVRTARSYAEMLTGRESDGVSALGRDPDGWRVVVEVVEVPRVPSTTDVLASYELRLDDDGDLLEYRRLRRYYRNVAAEDLDL